MSLQLRTSLKTTLVFLALSLVFVLSLIIASAQAHPSSPAQTPNLFVANQTGNTIREFAPSGEDLGYFVTTGLNGPTGLAFDKRGNLYVTNFGGNTIREFSPTGQDLGNFATTGLNTPAGLAFDKHGDLYVSNRGDGTIREFSPTGEDLGYFATTGMITPVGLAFSPKPQDENENGDG